MTILLPDTATEQTLSYIPMNNLAVTKAEFLDEQANTTSEAVLGTQVDNSYWVDLGITITLKNNFIYMLTLYNDEEVIFRDKVFVTDQPVSTFSVNKNQYINPPSAENQYIIYEG